MQEKGRIIVEVIIKGRTVRICGKHGDISIHVNEENDYFCLSLCRDGFELGCLPSVQICKDHAVITNTLEKGKNLR